MEDAPYFVRALRPETDRVVLVLSDGTEEAWDPESSRIGSGEALYALVKRAARGGPFEARFTPHAQTSLAPLLVEGDSPAVRIGGQVHVIGAKSARFG
ncbi:MAG TPA: hypothetical protein VF765_15685 [Polyangiaceae bacterium]